MSCNDNTSLFLSAYHNTSSELQAKREKTPVEHRSIVPLEVYAKDLERKAIQDSFRLMGEMLSELRDLSPEQITSHERSFTKSDFVTKSLPADVELKDLTTAHDRFLYYSVKIENYLSRPQDDPEAHSKLLSQGGEGAEQDDTPEQGNTELVDHRRTLQERITSSTAAFSRMTQALRRKETNVAITHLNKLGALMEGYWPILDQDRPEVNAKIQVYGEQKATGREDTVIEDPA